MKQINTNALYDLGKYLQQLRTIPGDANQLQPEHMGIVYFAQFWLKSFLDAKEIPLDLSEGAANSLLSAIANITDKKSKNQAIEDYEISTIWHWLGQFETVMAAVLQEQLTYIVSQVSGYSMQLLVKKAEVNLQQDTTGAIPDHAKKDFREAGRCLAFELSTAAGIHLMRATESVLRKYYKLVTGKDADANNLDWGTCTKELEQSQANQKVVHILDQIRDLHRNPLMHPEDFLDMKQALGLFDISKSAINALAEEIIVLEAKKGVPTSTPRPIGKAIAAKP